MIVLRAGLTALAFLGTDQLFEFAVKFPDLRRQVVVELIGDESVNVAVWDGQLEQFDLERYFF